MQDIATRYVPGPPSAHITGMNERTRRAWAAYLVAFLFLPPESHEPPLRIRRGPRERFLRALEFLALTDPHATYSAAAKAAGVPRGTVASWLHRHDAFRKESERVLFEAVINLAEPDLDPDAIDFDALDRILRLPEVELARIAVGEVPSRSFMDAAFDLSWFYNGGEHQKRAWLEAFPG